MGPWPSFSWGEEETPPKGPFATKVNVSTDIMSTLKVRRSVSTILFNQAHSPGRCEAAVGPSGPLLRTFTAGPTCRLSSGKRLLCTAAKEAQRRNNELIMFASVCRDHKSQLWLDCDTQITRVNFKHVTDTYAEGGASDHMRQKNKPRWIVCHLCFITGFTSRKNTSCEEKKNRIKVQMTHFWVLFCRWCHGRGRTSSVYDDLFWLANYKDIVLCAFRKQTIYSWLRLPSVVK